MHAHDAADALLVDALRRRRREMHADRRTRRVPTLGQQLRIDQHVDLAALVRRERLGEPHGRRASRNGLRLDPGCAELLREVVGVVDARRVDDPRRVVEAIAVQARGGLVRAWWSRVLARISWSKSPPTIGTELMAATGGTRRLRSGAISPRRAASCSGRSSTEAGKTSETCFAISCSVAVIPM